MTDSAFEQKSWQTMRAEFDLLSKATPTEIEEFVQLCERASVLRGRMHEASNESGGHAKPSGPGLTRKAEAVDQYLVVDLQIPEEMPEDLVAIAAKYDGKVVTEVRRNGFASELDAYTTSVRERQTQLDGAKERVEEATKYRDLLSSFRDFLDALSPDIDDHAVEEVK